MAQESLVEFDSRRRRAEESERKKAPKTPYQQRYDARKVLAAPGPAAVLSVCFFVIRLCCCVLCLYTLPFQFFVLRWFFAFIFITFVFRKVLLRYNR